MAADPYEALQDDLEAMCIANAGLLVEVAELTAIVESVRAVRVALGDRAVGCQALAWAGDFYVIKGKGLSEAALLLDEVDGL